MLDPAESKPAGVNWFVLSVVAAMARDVKPLGLSGSASWIKYKFLRTLLNMNNFAIHKPYRL